MKSKFRRFNDHPLNRIGLSLIILFLLASSRPMIQDSGEKFPNINAISSRVEVIEVDTSPPSIELISPQMNGSGVGVGEYIILDIKDNTSVDNVLYNWDNDPFNLTATNGEHYMITQTPIDYGVHILTVYANDTSDNWNSKVFLFTVGNIILGEISDAVTGATISGALVVLFNDSTGAIMETETTNGTGHYRFAGVLPGQYGLNVSAIGWYPGSVSGLSGGFDQRMDFGLLEAINPTIELLSPANDSLIPLSTLITVNISDNAGLYQIHHHWDDANSNSSLIVWGNSSYVYTVSDLPDTPGIHILHIYVEDASINSAYVTFRFIIEEPVTSTTTTTTIPTTTMTEPSLAPGFTLIISLVFILAIVGRKRRRKQL